MTIETETTSISSERKSQEPRDPVHIIREGAIAASIWKRQGPSGFAYFDFTLSRSWKSASTERTGYSKNYFSRNVEELISVSRKAADWIAEHEQKDSLQASALAA
ncbi:hypothetical protein [Lacipirellula parvula]|uniref:Uncharacterized protein n=1 Tax=Lacipirellula parvula TaxID=2650471 RepID=A0A5K7XMM5_9BACT|nr:hypothetical protein [Lacipirellula parvula]BBO34329.1 hypothetical protein PLANPX_3941 [Lacipirellula parvula]